MTETRQRNSSPYPHIPAILESDDREFRDAGVTSTVQIAGHPIHPILVQFPVAFLSGALFTDAAYWFLGDTFWARASYWLILAGFIVAIAAAITGMLDFLRIERVRKRTAGWAHMVLNVGALVLTIVNLAIRWNNPVSPILPWGLILSLVVATLIGISGWYGGELIYRHKIAVIGNGSEHQP